MNRWTVRLIVLIAAFLATALDVVWTLESYQHSEYMKWNISHP